MGPLLRSRLQILFLVLTVILNNPTVEAFRASKRMNSGRLGHASGTARLLGDNRLRNHEDSDASTVSATAVRAAARFKNFEQVLDTFHAEPVIIYFGTQKCGPCQLMKREVESLRKMVGGEMKMFSVDTEKWPRVGSRFSIARLPCLVVFHEGEIKLRLEGVNKAEEVVELVRLVQ